MSDAFRCSVLLRIAKSHTAIPAAASTRMTTTINATILDPEKKLDDLDEEAGDEVTVGGVTGFGLFGGGGGGAYGGGVYGGGGGACWLS